MGGEAGMRELLALAEEEGEEYLRVACAMQLQVFFPFFSVFFSRLPNLGFDCFAM